MKVCHSWNIEFEPGDAAEKHQCGQWTKWQTGVRFEVEIAIMEESDKDGFKISQLQLIRERE